MPGVKAGGGVKRHNSYKKSSVDHKKIKKAQIEAASFTSPEFKVLLKDASSRFLGKLTTL